MAGVSARIDMSACHVCRMMWQGILGLSSNPLAGLFRACYTSLLGLLSSSHHASFLPSISRWRISFIPTVHLRWFGSASAAPADQHGTPWVTNIGGWAANHRRRWSSGRSRANQHAHKRWLKVVYRHTTTMSWTSPMHLLPKSNWVFVDENQTDSRIRYL